MQTRDPRRNKPYNLTSMRQRVTLLWVRTRRKRKYRGAQPQQLFRGHPLATLQPLPAVAGPPFSPSTPPNSLRSLAFLSISLHSLPFPSSLFPLPSFPLSPFPRYQTATVTTPLGSSLPPLKYNNECKSLLPPLLPSTPFLLTISLALFLFN